MSVRARRRRTRASLAVQVRTFWVIALLLAIAVVAATIAFVQAPQLRVRRVIADVAAGPVRPSDVLVAARIPPDANLWLLNTGAVRRRVEAIPYVLHARTQRGQFPTPTLRIDVALRVPTGCVHLGAVVVTIDATARVLQSGCASPTLPQVDAGNALAPVPGTTLAAPDIDRLLGDAKTIAATVPVRIVRRDRFGGLEAVTADGVLLRLGADDDLAAKLALVAPIRRATGTAKRLRAIDVRAPATPIVEFP